jgi:hypothetical protein
MASAKLTKALAEKKVLLQKAPTISGEVQLLFYPVYNARTGKTETPAPLLIAHGKAVDPLTRTGVTVDHLRNSNLEDLVRAQVVVVL